MIRSRALPCDGALIASTRVAEPCAGRTKSFVLAATIIGSGMAFIDGAVVGVALPVIGTDLEASLATMQWVVNAYVLVSAALTLIGGAVGDRFGRKRVFIAGILIFTLASLACGLARGAIPLIAARAAQGIGGAFMAGARAALQSAISIAVADSFRVLMLGASALAALSAISAAATIPSEAPS